jgi:NAD(P) transhydrogenase
MQAPLTHAQPAQAPSTYDYDMLVIGSGPSGRRAAIQFAKLNRTILVVEKGRRVGGVSVHTGTIPSKTLRETVLNLSGWRERGFYGRSYRVKQDIGAVDLIARLQKTLDHEVEVLEHQFSRKAVKTACGEARFVGPHQIEITADSGEVRIVTAAYVLIACGTRPFRPEYVPFDGRSVFDSDEFIDLPKLPRSLAVIGAGVIGVEYATIFSALDVAVTLIEPRPTFLDFIDKELIDEFMHELRDRNVALRLGSAVNAIERSESGRIVTRLSDGRHVASEMLLFAAGRVGATDRLNLAAAGIAVDHRGRVAVDHDIADQRAAYLCRRRRHRLSESRLDLDGTGTGRRLPRTRNGADGAAGILSLRHLFGAGNLDRRPDRGGGAQAGHPL